MILYYEKALEKVFPRKALFSGLKSLPYDSFIQKALKKAFSKKTFFLDYKAFYMIHSYEKAFLRKVLFPGEKPPISLFHKFWGWMGGDVKDLKGLSSSFSLGFCKFC
jgi:hypothetical protein